MTAERGRLAGAYDHAPFLRPLAALSAAIGRDLAQIQGPGGNTSLKHEDMLWVKASGTDLAEAEERNIFVPVSLPEARAAVLAGRDVPAVRCANGGRPSIECSLHALMPQPVVLHTHDVDAIAWAVREDAEKALAAPMQGLNWAFIPYARPGLPLTRAVRAVLAERRPDILVLGNHGLVVSGETPEAAAARLAAVRQRLALVPRQVAPGADDALAALCEGTRLAPAIFREAHWPALDAAALRVAAGGALYPDHVVFLGAETAIVPARARDRLGETEARLVLVPGLGVLADKGLTPAAQAMAACLGLVTVRVAGDVRLRYLGAEEIAGLLGWEAERYRQKLAQRKKAAMRG